MFDFTKQVVIITGAAGDLGQAVVRAFQETGANLVLVDRGINRLNSMFPELNDHLRHYLANQVDLTNPEAVSETVTKTIEQFGKIDVLVNIAGGFRAGSLLDEAGLDTWEYMLQLNTRTMLLVTRAVLPHMIAAGSGKVVSIATRAAQHGSSGLAAYSASKAAVLRISESLSAELKGKGININCILPSTIDTPANRKSMPKADFNKWVKPEAIADVIMFLASEAGRALNGVSLPV